MVYIENSFQSNGFWTVDREICKSNNISLKEVLNWRNIAGLMPVALGEFLNPEKILVVIQENIKKKKN